MKKLYSILLLTISVSTLMAQESPEKVMERRAREMYKAITVNDKELWKKFITENYSQALIDKPMRASVNTEENGTVVNTAPEEPKGGNNIEKKAAMYAQLHNDFGDSEISSLKVNGQKAIMVLQSDSGAVGTISLTFNATKPYLIEGLGIEVEN